MGKVGGVGAAATNLRRRSARVRKRQPELIDNTGRAVCVECGLSTGPFHDLLLRMDINPYRGWIKIDAGYLCPDCAFKKGGDDHAAETT